MIDLRSDTLTRPTAGMREAMAQAPVGDDVYGEDPSVAALESRVAALLGHEAGLYCATGSLANVLGVAVHVAPGQEVLCDSGAHIARAEMGAHGALSGVTMRTWVTPDGRVAPEQVEALLAPDAGPYLVSTACVEIGWNSRDETALRCRACTGGRKRLPIGLRRRRIPVERAARLADPRPCRSTRKGAFRRS